MQSLASSCLVGACPEGTGNGASPPPPPPVPAAGELPMQSKLTERTFFCEGAIDCQIVRIRTVFVVVVVILSEEDLVLEKDSVFEDSVSEVLKAELV